MQECAEEACSDEDKERVLSCEILSISSSSARPHLFHWISHQPPHFSLKKASETDDWKMGSGLGGKTAGRILLLSLWWINVHKCRCALLMLAQTDPVRKEKCVRSGWVQKIWECFHKKYFPEITGVKMMMICVSMCPLKRQISSSIYLNSCPYLLHIRLCFSFLLIFVLFSSL